MTSAALFVSLIAALAAASQSKESVVTSTYLVSVYADEQVT